jgi:hypothetical protein
LARQRLQVAGKFEHDLRQWHSGNRSTNEAKSVESGRLRIAQVNSSVPDSDTMTVKCPCSSNPIRGRVGGSLDSPSDPTAPTGRHPFPDDQIAGVQNQRRFALASMDDLQLRLALQALSAHQTRGVRRLHNPALQRAVGSILLRSLPTAPVPRIFPLSGRYQPSKASFESASSTTNTRRNSSGADSSVDGWLVSATVAAPSSHHPAANHHRRRTRGNVPPAAR